MNESRREKNPEYVPWETLQDCLHLSLLNAKNSLKDARLLHDKDRFSSSMVLGVLALEELGKGQLCLEYALNKKNVSKREYKEKFRGHKAKMEASQRIISTPPTITNFRSKLYEDEKFDAVYVDFDWGLRKWVPPRALNIPLKDEPFAILFELAFTGKADGKYSELKEAGNMIDKIFVLNLIELGEKCADLLELSDTRAK